MNLWNTSDSAAVTTLPIIRIRVTFIGTSQNEVMGVVIVSCYFWVAGVEAQRSPQIVSYSYFGTFGSGISFTSRVTRSSVE